MIVAVVRVALDGEEEIAGLERAGVDRDARRSLRPAARSAGAEALPPAPPRSTASLMPPPSAPRALRRRRRTAASGRRRSGRFHGPCPAITSASPAASMAIAGADGRRPDRRFRAPGAAARIAARIAAGSSERGLSSVTMTTSARRAAISPMIGRLPGSRSPPQPNTTTRRPRTNGRKARKRLFERVGLVRVVDEHRRAADLADPLQPSRRAVQALQRLEHRVGIAAGRDAQPGGDQRVRDLEVARQRQLQAPSGARRTRGRASTRTDRARPRRAGSSRPSRRP